jgi:hypothetical protein
LNRLTNTQVAALIAARDGGGLEKTGARWHARNHEVVSKDGYRPDRTTIFGEQTIMALFDHGLLTGDGALTAEGHQAIVAARKRAIVERMEGAFATGAKTAAAALRCRR